MLEILIELWIDHEWFLGWAVGSLRPYNLLWIHVNQPLLFIPCFHFIAKLLESLGFPSFQNNTCNLAPFLLRRAAILIADSAPIKVLKLHVPLLLCSIRYSVLVNSHHTFLFLFIGLKLHFFAHGLVQRGSALFVPLLGCSKSLLHLLFKFSGIDSCHPWL